MTTNDYITTYLEETVQIAESLDHSMIARAIGILREVRHNGGRLFILGVGGGAGHAGHATNDFRKIAGIETYAPTDNVSELTAWTNDVGWEVVFEKWLQTSRLRADDCLMIFSVGGGSVQTSRNLVRAMDYAKSLGARIIAVVSRNGGHAAAVADAPILIPVADDTRITPHAEGWQAVVWHLLVNAIDSAKG